VRVVNRQKPPKPPLAPMIAMTINRLAAPAMTATAVRHLPNNPQRMRVEPRL
jgi:hypothetical protein